VTANPARSTGDANHLDHERLFVEDARAIPDFQQAMLERVACTTCMFLHFLCRTFGVGEDGERDWQDPCPIPSRRPSCNRTHRKKFWPWDNEWAVGAIAPLRPGVGGTNLADLGVESVKPTNYVKPTN